MAEDRKMEFDDDDYAKIGKMGAVAGSMVAFTSAVASLQMIQTPFLEYWEKWVKNEFDEACKKAGRDRASVGISEMGNYLIKLGRVAVLVAGGKEEEEKIEWPEEIDG